MTPQDIVSAMIATARQMRDAARMHAYEGKYVTEDRGKADAADDILSDFLDFSVYPTAQDLRDYLQQMRLRSRCATELHRHVANKRTGQYVNSLGYVYGEMSAKLAVMLRTVDGEGDNEDN